MQGWRISMEDAHTSVLNLGDADGDDQISIFAVYDGHGGRHSSSITANRR